MKKLEFTMMLLHTEEIVRTAVSSLVEDLSNKFLHDASTNEEAVLQFDANFAMINYLVDSRESSYWKKASDKSKKSLDAAMEKLGIDPSGMPGDTVELFASNMLQFSKRQNEDGTSTLVVDLVTELSRLGVKKSIIDAALKKASKPKRGNVYYEVKETGD